MARNRRFAFPLPRRSRPKACHSDNDVAPSIPSTASVPDWPSLRDELSSKAHRILGTADTVYRSNPSQTHIPASPAYMSIAASHASHGSHADDRTYATATDNAGYGNRLLVAKRSSSNFLSRSYTNESGRGSDNTSVTQRLRPQTSNSTMRSHYDAKNSPLAISQQTSDSAVRDRALRRGHPPVMSDHVYHGHQPSPASPRITEDAVKEVQRRSKPARLDLSTLFPKPKGADFQDFRGPMLSPEKMVNSPAAMSMASDYFSRPMTKEALPKIGEVVQRATRHRNQVKLGPTSPCRNFDREDYDSAKVNVRRPPKGVQHWFDALDEDSDEWSEDGRAPLDAPRAVRPNHVSQVPVRTSSSDEMLRHAGSIHSGPRSKWGTPQSKHDSFAHEDIVDVGRLTSPSQYSVNTHISLNSSRTKGSALSNSNLKDASVLSFSSSDDEEVDQTYHTRARKFSIRKSLDLVADAGEIIVGQAQAFDVRPHIRRPSAGFMSTRSTNSMSAATIKVMYTPEVPFIPYQYQSQYQNQYQNHYPRNNSHSSKWSSHVRQPSVIHEDEDARPRTVANVPLSPSTHSIRSARTSVSEPQDRTNGSRKMMAVTAEEEALLELMRKKRAELQKNGSSPPDAKSVPATQRLRTPSESSRDPHCASAFRALEGSSSPALVPESQKAPSSCSTSSPSPLNLPSRGRPIQARSNTTTSHLRDSSASATSDTYSDRQSSSPVTRLRLPHYIPMPAEFSPLEPFPLCSPTPTASVTSPTDPETSHPLSPITPGLRRGEADVVVKVASSDTSADTDEVAILEAQLSDGVKSDSLHELSAPAGHHRRRTASSAADVTFPAPPTSAARDLPPLSKTPSRPPSLSTDQLFPAVPRNTPRRVDDFVQASPIAVTARVRASSMYSTASRTSSHSQGSAPHFAPPERRCSNKLATLSRGSSVASRRRSRDVGRDSGRDSVLEKRSSVSDDVLAAWNSLGGSY